MLRSPRVNDGSTEPGAKAALDPRSGADSARMGLPDGGAPGGEAERLERYRSDLALVRAALAGQEPARARFAERMRCVPRVLAILNRRCAGSLAAEDLHDLAQEALLQIWQRLETFEARATLETWTERFCFHLFMNRLRSRRRERSRNTAVPQDELVAERGHAPALDEGLLRALEELGPPEADILRLKHFDELTFEEIGTLLGISPNTAKTQYYRGLRWLRQRLETERPA